MKGTRGGGVAQSLSRKLRVPGFFYFLGCTQTGDYPPEELVKFGYRKVMKVEGFKIPFFFFLATCWNLCAEIWQFFLI